jgi:hypothetical protein
MLSLPLLLMIIAAAIFGAFWQNSLGARERANRAAQDACERMQVQFLDGTVAFARLALARDAGRLTLRRTYVFDYTAASIERLQGFVVVLGQRIESIGFAPGTTGSVPRNPAPRLPDINITPTANDDHKVLNLEEWRQRRNTSNKPEKPPAKPPLNPGGSSGNSSDQGW